MVISQPRVWVSWKSDLFYFSANGCNRSVSLPRSERKKFYPSSCSFFYFNCFPFDACHCTTTIIKQTNKQRTAWLITLLFSCADQVETSSTLANHGQDVRFSLKWFCVLHHNLKLQQKREAIDSAFMSTQGMRTVPTILIELKVVLRWIKSSLTNVGKSYLFLVCCERDKQSTSCVLFVCVFVCYVKLWRHTCGFHVYLRLPITWWHFAVLYKVGLFWWKLIFRGVTMY